MNRADPVHVRRGEWAPAAAGADRARRRVGELVGDGDIEAQTELVLAHLLRQLEAGGAGPDDVVKSTVYVADDHDAMIRVWEVVQRSPIASAPSNLLGVALLGYSG